MNITNSMTSILNILLDLMSYCINLLDSITFFGLSILDYAIIITTIGAVLTLLVTMPQGIYNQVERINRIESKRKGNKKNE